MGWQIVLTDLNWVPIGEILNAKDRKINFALNGHDTLTFNVRLDNPLAGVLASCAGFLKVYKNNNLVYTGPIISSEETATKDGATVAINSAGMGWYISKLFVLTGITDPSVYPWALNVADPTWSWPMKKADVVMYFMRAGGRFIRGGTANPHLRKYEIDVDSGPNTSTQTITFDYAANKGRNLNELLTEFSSGLNGFDWRILPIDNKENPTSYAAKFTSADSIGQERLEAIFEWGTSTTSNLTGYTKTVSREQQASNVWILQSGGGTAADMGNYSFDSNVNWGGTVDIIQTDISDFGMQTLLMQDHISLRENPRTILSITPHIDPQTTGRLPKYDEDFFLGDKITARARFNGSTRFDAQMRVWGVSFDIDDKGTELMGLTLIEQ